MTRYDLGFLLVLMVGLVGTGIGIVYMSYASRMEFMALQALHTERRELEVRWGRLRLEEAALTTHSRIEVHARKLLGMRLPRDGDVRVIEGGRDGRR